jgi:peptide deformylase
MSEIITFNTEESAFKDVSQPEIKKIYQLVNEKHPLLKQVLPEFDFSNPPINPNELASGLVETCKENKGYGLSANQCGLPYRVFVMGADEYVAFFNPKILSFDDECHMVEGCLSFPLLGLKITRPKNIEVEYTDFNGEKKQTRLTGISARVFLHELDHLNGITYLERAKPMALQLGIKKRKKMLNGIRIKI